MRKRLVSSADPPRGGGSANLETYGSPHWLMAAPPAIWILHARSVPDMLQGEEGNFQIHPGSPGASSLSVPFREEEMWVRWTAGWLWSCKKACCLLKGMKLPPMSPSPTSCFHVEAQVSCRPSYLALHLSYFSTLLLGEEADLGLPQQPNNLLLLFCFFWALKRVNNLASACSRTWPSCSLNCLTCS